MAKLSNALMALVGTAGAVAFFASLVFSGVLPELTALPIMLLVAVAGAGLSGLLIGVSPIYALVGSGGPKQPKKKKQKKAATSSAAVDESDGFASDTSFVGDGSSDVSSLGDGEFSDAYDSVVASDEDFVDVDESNVADLIGDESGLGEDDPFDVDDAFESDSRAVDLAIDDSETFDDDFEFGPESDIDDLDSDKNA